MPATRHQVAADVANVFLPAKITATRTATASLEALSVMIDARAAARMPDPAFGNDILMRMRDAANQSFDALMTMHDVHAMLAPIRRDWAVPPGAYGPNDTPEERKRTFMGLEPVEGTEA